LKFFLALDLKEYSVPVQKEQEQPFDYQNDAVSFN